MTKIRTLENALYLDFFMNSAKKYKDYYKTSKFHLNVRIHPSSMLLKDEPECVVYHELVLTTQ